MASEHKASSVDGVNHKERKTNQKCALEPQGAYFMYLSLVFFVSHAS